MKASNRKAQPSSVLGISIVDSSESTAGVTVFVSPEPTVIVTTDAAAAQSSLALPVQIEHALQSAITSRATFTSQDATNLTEVETYKLAQSRRLSWQEMLQATEQSFRQAEEYRRTLREIESARESTR